MIIDQHDDIKKETLEKIANAGVVLSPKEDVHELNDRDFALIIQKEKRAHRKFPVSDEESTKLSAIYFSENKNKLPDEMRKTAGANIKEAFLKNDMDIPNFLEEYDNGTLNNTVSGSLVKKASVSDDDFGLVYKKDGEKVRKFPLTNKKNTKRALEKFDDVKGKLDDDQAKKLKENILDACHEFGININEETEIEKSATLKRDMKFRTKNLTKEAQLPYMKVADMVEKDEICIEKAAAVMERLDDENNLHRTFSPMETLTGNKPNTIEIPKREKTASIEDKLPSVISNPKMKQAFLKKLKEHFDEGMVEGIAQDPQTVIESLPDPHKDIIENKLDEVMS